MKKFTSRLHMFGLRALRRIVTGPSRLFVIFLVSLIVIFVVVDFDFKLHNGETIWFKFKVI